MKVLEKAEKLFCMNRSDRKVCWSDEVDQSIQKFLGQSKCVEMSS